MKRTKAFQASERAELLAIFEEIDAGLAARRKMLEVTLVGGASLILLGVRERATMDIDIADRVGAELFCKLCEQRGIPVDRITVASTVDLLHCPTIPIFQGAWLTVQSVTTKDLIKLKLERFRKQDPEDIYAIIEHEALSFKSFRDLVFDMIPDFIGNVRELILSAQIVVEQLYAEHLDAFKEAVRKKAP